MLTLSGRFPRALASSLAGAAAVLAASSALLTPSSAEAFCGFYVAGADAEMFNDATVVVLMRDGTRTVLSMQNDYQGPPEDFALVIPVPVVLSKDDVKTLRPELFDRVETLSSPRLVEYWEQDPCADLDVYDGLGLIGTGRGGGGTGYGSGPGGGAVTVEAQFAVGEYEIVILSATESSGLDAWLRENGYSIPAGAEPLLRPYVEQGSKFFIAKVDPAKVEFNSQGRAKLSPLRFHYDSDDFALPVRLGLINSPGSERGKQDLLIHILAPRVRYQVANYANVTIPTNLDVKAETAAQFGEFYVSLFDHTLEQHPGAVVTEYSWGASSCDPCPGPDAALTAQELLELGGDVMPNWSNSVELGFASPSSVVRQGKPTVEGSLDQDIVRRIIRAHANEIRSCYNKGLSAKPTLGGELVVDFSIDAKGRVTQSAVHSSTLDDAKVGTCVAKAAKRWKFPKPSEGEVVTVRAPFELRSRGTSGPAPTTPNSFVLTRLHARYDSSSLGEDLVFETAPTMVGGRELYIDGKLEQGVQLNPEDHFSFATTNNFQARYAIRHAWTGAITCEQPTRGRWGGPPEGQARAGETVVAKQLSVAKRGGTLGSFITAQARAQLGGVALSRAPEPDAQPQGEDPVGAEPAKLDINTDIPAAPKGCACASADAPSAPGALGALGLLGLLGLRRRRT